MRDFLKTIGSNRRMAAGVLAMDFKKPWNYLANLPALARRGKATNRSNPIWWRRRELNPRPRTSP